MALFVVIALVVLGLAMVVFGIVALRDEPPGWMLRVKRPGRVLALGLVVLLAALIVNYFRYSIEEEVADFVGHPVSCEEVGELQVDGERRQVYACIAPQDQDRRIGCFARVGDTVADVSSRAEAPGAFARDPECR